MMNTKETAAEAYARRANEVDGLVKQLTSLLEVHRIGHEQRPRSWGFAGDLALVAEYLRSAVDVIDSDLERDRP